MILSKQKRGRVTLSDKLPLKTILKGYIKSRAAAVLLILLCIAMPIVIFTLYSVPLDAIEYSTAIIVAMSIALSIVDFSRYRRKIREIELMARHIDTLPDGLYKAEQLAENMLCGVISDMCDSRSRLITEQERRIKEINDYYNVWVHQIKTPISAMSLLLDNTDEHDAKIGMQLFKIEQYVDMALNYLRSSAESTDYVIKQYPLAPIVKRAVHKFSPMFIQKHISLELAPIDLCVYTDEKWLEFVIGQLLSNSLKYTDSGKIRIYAKSDRLIIEDTGIGIAAADLPRVFENGYTGYNGRQQRKSTGIGLYLCRRVLVKLSHDIELESEQGKGTRAIIIFHTQNEVIE